MSSLHQPWLVTLDEVREHRRMPEEKTEDDELIKGFIEDASEQMISELNRNPVPWKQTQLFDWRGPEMPNARTLNMDDDLLVVDTLTNGDAVVIVASDFVLDDANRFPKRRVRLKINSGIAFTYNDDPEQAISVLGTWGYVPHWDNAWKTLTTNSAQKEIVDADITVTSVDDIRIGDYLRMDSEYFFVTAIAGTAVTVDSAVLGTTGAVHTSSTNIDQFQQVRDIRGAMKEIVSYMYKTKDKAGGRVKVFDNGTVTVEELNPSVQATIKRHRRLNWKVA